MRILNGLADTKNCHGYWADIEQSFVFNLNYTSRIGPNVGLAAALETKISIPPKWCSVCEKDSGTDQLELKL